MRALLLVDLQNDFVPGGALAVPDGDSVVSVANRLQSRVDCVFATQDWHPADHLSFASQHPGRVPGEQIDLAGLPQILWPDHCVQGTLGADFAPQLDRSRIQRVFRKGQDRTVDSYSGFFDNGRRKDTGLANHLRGLRVERLYVMGLATDYCVKWTALDARDLGFNTSVVNDGCRGIDLSPGDVERALEGLRRAGCPIVQSVDV